MYTQWVKPSLLPEQLTIKFNAAQLVWYCKTRFLELESEHQVFLDLNANIFDLSNGLLGYVPKSDVPNPGAQAYQSDNIADLIIQMIEEMPELQIIDLSNNPAFTPAAYYKICDAVDEINKARDAIDHIRIESDFTPSSEARNVKLARRS